MPEFIVEAPFEPPVRGLCTLAPGDPAQAPRWLQQVHGKRVVDLADWHPGIEADAAWTGAPGPVAAIRTADCVPLLLADRDGACVAAVHAGWRGLAAGVIGAAIRALPVEPGRLLAWIGPCIRAPRYEVGRDVRRALAEFDSAFSAGRPGHWYADLAAIACRQLFAAGVASIEDCGICTADDRRLPSHRRDRSTARLATMIWIGDPERTGQGAASTSFDAFRNRLGA